MTKTVVELLVVDGRPTIRGECDLGAAPRPFVPPLLVVVTVLVVLQQVWPRRCCRVAARSSVVTRSKCCDGSVPNHTRCDAELDQSVIGSEFATTDGSERHTDSS